MGAKDAQGVICFCTDGEQKIRRAKAKEQKRRKVPQAICSHSDGDSAVQPCGRTCFQGHARRDSRRSSNQLMQMCQSTEPFGKLL